MPEYKEGLEDTVRRVLDRGFEDMFENLDRITGVEPADIIRVLVERGETDVLDGYEEWLREGDAHPEDTHPSTMGEVPDPGDAESYKALDEHLKAVKAAREQAGE